jgi:hypothetical protein
LDEQEKVKDANVKKRLLLRQLVVLKNNLDKAKKSHRLVLLEIANHVNDDNGLAWPSQNTIARRTGLSRRWIVEIIADLVAVGELKIIPEGGPNGEQA